MKSIVYTFFLHLSLSTCVWYLELQIHFPSLWIYGPFWNMPVLLAMLFPSSTLFPYCCLHAGKLLKQPIYIIKGLNFCENPIFSALDLNQWLSLISTTVIRGSDWVYLNQWSRFIVPISFSGFPTQRSQSKLTAWLRSLKACLLQLSLGTQTYSLLLGMK